MESTTGNLVHLEEYVDTIISLPHEIQRNLTMIREHDSQVQDMEKDLFEDINEFMSLQSGKKEISSDERVELIKRIKNSFLSTLTHGEEKVSLSNQCYNLVEKHLVKMEEDLKCFEEEIRLSGYSDLLEKVRIERKRQREQVKNKKRQEALNNGESEESDEETEREKDNESSSEKEQQQQQQQRKRKPANRNASNPKKPRASAIEATKNTTTKPEADSDDETQMMKISRAERLLRRNKPNYVGKELSSSVPAAASEMTTETTRDDEEETKDDDNQGDDEAESGEEGAGNSEGENDNSEDHSEDNGEDHDEDHGEVHSDGNSNSHAKSEDPASLEDSTRQSSRPSRRPSKPSSSSTEQVYCTCHRVSFGEMIACDAKDCPVEWFHYECVGLKSPPKGKWYCKVCQEAMDAKTAAQLAVGISTRLSRRSG